MAKRVAGYRLIRLLGAGAHAEVWWAERRGDGTQVAVKLLLAPESASIRAAEAEARLLVELGHPALIGLHEVVRTGDSIALIMELARGGSLAGLLERRGRLTVAETVTMLLPIARGLAHTHEHGIVHGDVSAANILFTASGHAKLADLGAARLIADRLRPDQPLGTPAYLDPVVAAGGACSAAGDMFSLGAVALHAVTGSGPWHALAYRTRDPIASSRAQPSAAAIVDIAAAGVLPRLDVLLDGVPDPVAGCIAGMLDPQPATRYSAQRVISELRALSTDRGLAVASGRLAGAMAQYELERRVDSRRATGAAPAQPFAGAHRAPGDRIRPVSQIAAIPADLTMLARSPLRHAAGSGDDGSDMRHRRPKLGAIGRHLGLGVLLGSVVAVTVGLLPPLGGPDPGDGRATPRAAAVQRTLSSRRSAAADTVATPSRQGTSSRTGGSDRTETAVDAASLALAELDRHRERAFATGDPAELGLVYGSATLLEQDRRQLVGWGSGCRVTGLSTSYRVANARRLADGRLLVHATASLGPAELVCPDASGARHVRALAPLPPTTLVITLQQRGTRMVVVGEEPA